MFVVTNRITVKKGYAKQMAPNFTKGGPIESLKGFEGIEVWQIDKDFKNWVNSDVFKQAHKNTGKSEDSPVIKSEIVKSNVLSSLNRR